LLWQIRLHAKVESSAVVIRNIAYVGATDGRVLALDARTGRARWAYDTGGRINSSPSIWGGRLCVTTYAGSIFCLRRSNGRKLWHRYVRRNALMEESFYASPSTDGKRLFTISRDGKVVALSAVSGNKLWTHDLNTTGYSTPAVAHGRVFIGDFNGYLHAYRARDGKELWAQHLGGKLLGPALVAGGLVFCSNLETQTYGLRVRDGKVVWHKGLGKYSPGIVTERHYYFSLNGILIAALGRNSPPAAQANPKRARKHAAARSGKRRVPSAPKR
jgi:eukaryotic-like serine/threonine-protein kinase